MIAPTNGDTEKTAPGNSGPKHGDAQELEFSHASPRFAAGS
jgi:hypothetical protein